MDDRSFDYAIDRDDRIASVSDPWLEFARENRAFDLTRECVVGQSLWRFVAGEETRRLYEGLFHKVRSRAESISLPFRCDSPDRFRFMRLRLESGPRGSIDCRGVLLREQERPVFSILDRAFPRTEAHLPMCSLCKRVLAYGTRWIELEDAIRELHLFDATEVPEVDYSVCDDCAGTERPTPDGAAAV